MATVISFSAASLIRLGRQPGHTLMSPGGADGWLTLGGLANLQEGEYAELTGLQTSGSDLDVRASSWLGMVRLA